MSPDGKRSSTKRRVLSTHFPMLMLVTEESLLAGREMLDVLLAAVDGGVNVIQVRRRGDRIPARRTGLLASFFLGPFEDEQTDLLHFSDLASDAVDLRGAFVINGFPDTAREAGAQGVHLAEAHPATAREARRRAGRKMWISRSVHSVEAAVQAERDGADMLVLGTVFPSRSHPGGQTIGVEGVRAVCDAVTIPVIGIGGITAQNAGEVMRAGASGVAVIGAIFDADDPRAAAAELRATVDDAWRERPDTMQLTT